MVLKKIEAAGDTTATEITTAWRRPSAPRRSVGSEGESSGRGETALLIRAAPSFTECSDFDWPLRPEGACYRQYQLQQCLCWSRRRSVSRRYRFVSAEQATQIIIQKDSLGIERSPDAPEIMPAGIERCQAFGSLRVHFAPMRAALIALENFLHMLEIRLIGHASIHMHRNIGRLALIRRAEPDVIAVNEAALHWKMHSKLMLFNARLNLGNHSAEMLAWNVVFHLLKAHQAGRSEESMAIVHLVDGCNGLGRKLADGFAKARNQPTALRKHPIDTVLQHHLIECAPEVAAGGRRVSFIQEFRLHPLSIGKPEELKMAVLLLILLQVGNAVCQSLPMAPKPQPFGRHHAQRYPGNHAERSH